MRDQGKDVGTKLDIKVREASPGDAPACASLLASLPEWFGFPDVNAGYIASLKKSPAFVAEVAGMCPASSSWSGTGIDRPK